MNYIAYYRVSTKRQGESGLGLEAQKASVTSFIGLEYTDNKLLAEFTDIESGANDMRPNLHKALAMARKYKATLLIAKLDRLSRSVTFISVLLDTGVKFTCCDMPEANELTIHLMAALAQWERKRIQQRIKEALQAKRARGEKLGNINNLTSLGRQLGAASNRTRTLNNPNIRRAKAYAQQLRNNGATLAEIAKELNYTGFKASKGGEFSSEQVNRLLIDKAIAA